MANGGFQGPVDQKTMIGMQGAIQEERGFARMWSAGASPGVQAAYQQSAANKGALAANNIRMRYYKKEWEQIRETQIKPLTDQLFAAEQAYKQATASTTMPVPRMVGHAEGRQITDEANPPVAQQPALIPGKPTKEGAQNQEAVPMPPQQQPNVAVGQGSIGALEHHDALALMDPTTGSPVELASARGIELMNKASYDFWEQHKRVNIEMMDTLSDYAGNPYAAQAQDGLMENLQTRAGHGATGSLDPMAQQDWMNKQQQFDIEQSQRIQDRDKGAFDLEQGQARLEAQAADARSMAADPKFAGHFDQKLLEKLQSGKPLTQRELSKVAAVRNMVRDLEEKDILQKARQGVFTIPNSLVNVPENWRAELQKDVTYQHDYSRILSEHQNETYAAIAGMDDEGIRQVFSNAGAPERVINTALAKLWNDPNVTEWMNLIAADPAVEQAANDSAFLLSLARTERQQATLTPVIDNAIETFIARLDRAQQDRGGPPIAQDRKDAVRADRYATFFTQQYGYEPPADRDIETQRAVDAYRTRSDRKRQDYTLGLSEQRAPAQTAPERAAESSEIPAGQRDPSIQPPTEEKSPTIGEPAQVSEAMRVYGIENPFTELWKDIQRSRNQKPRVQSRSLAFDVSGRSLGDTPAVNPYLDQPVNVLQQLANSLQEGTEAHTLITEALQQYAQE